MKDHRSTGIEAASLYASYEFYFGKRDRPMQSTSLRKFHNALRILRSLDHHEVSFLKDAEWTSFRDNPYTFFITTSDANALHIWQALQRRQPAELRDELREDKLPATQEIYTLLLDIAVMFENWERDSRIADPTGAVRGQRKATAQTIRKFLKEREPNEI